MAMGSPLDPPLQIFSCVIGKRYGLMNVPHNLGPCTTTGLWIIHLFYFHHLHGRRRIFSVVGATMKWSARTLNIGRKGSLTKGRAVHFSTGQNKAAIQGGKECF